MIRPLGKFTVCQRTSDGMFNATDLLRQWNLNTGMQKQISHFMENAATKDFIQVIDCQEKISQRNSAESSESISYKIVKGNRTKSKPNEYWFHPFLFIDFAMWLNPKFKYDVIKFVYDQLIKFRHDAGDNYRSISSAIRTFLNKNYAQLAKALNYIIFGYHAEGLRQTATQAQLKELAELEQKFAFACDMGYIKNFEHLMNELRKIYQNKYNTLKIS